MDDTKDVPRIEELDESNYLVHPDRVRAGVQGRVGDGERPTRPDGEVRDQDARTEGRMRR
jgi:hypothetical protein